MLFEYCMFFHVPSFIMYHGTNEYKVSLYEGLMETYTGHGLQGNETPRSYTAGGPRQSFLWRAPFLFCIK